MSAQLELARNTSDSERPRHVVHVTRAVRRDRAHATQLPASRLLSHALPFVDWSDAYAIGIPSDSRRRDPQEWADAVFRSAPLTVRVLFGVRELAVRLIGVERGGSHAFRTVARTDHEVLLGVTQAHLGFRASVLVEVDRVVVSTVVELRNRRGRAYFALVRRLHPAVVRRMLNRAARTMAAPA